jgi:hypothetical protein
MDANSFSPGQEPCRKARPSLTVSEGAARRASHLGCPFFGLLFLTPGIHALRPSGQLRCSHTLLRVRGHAKKSDWASAEARNARRVGEQPGVNAQMKTKVTG